MLSRDADAFAVVTRDEIWLLDSRLTLREERLSHGIAAFDGSHIVATDGLDAELLRRCDEEADALRGALPADIGVEITARVVVSARRVGPAVLTEATVSFASGYLSLVSNAQHAQEDCRRLAALASVAPEAEADESAIPILWRNGSAAVLLHEGVGHPAEQRHAPLRWPAWLSVRDEPPFAFDDRGERTENRDLLAGEEPSTWRRASFADVPLRRLSHVVVRQHDAPFVLPERRIEVHLVGGGHYDPLTETVTVAVTAAELVEKDRAQRLRPFMYRRSRAHVAASLRGAAGPPERYPGVVCSLEGQEIVVGSSAPMLLTEPGRA